MITTEFGEHPRFVFVHGYEREGNETLSIADTSIWPWTIILINSMAEDYPLEAAVNDLAPVVAHLNDYHELAALETIDELLVAIVRKYGPQPDVKQPNAPTSYTRQ